MHTRTFIETVLRLIQLLTVLTRSVKMHSNVFLLLQIKFLLSRLECVPMLQEHYVSSAILWLLIQSPRGCAHSVYLIQNWLRNNSLWHLHRYSREETNIKSNKMKKTCLNILSKNGNICETPRPVSWEGAGFQNFCKIKSARLRECCLTSNIRNFVYMPYVSPWLLKSNIG